MYRLKHTFYSGWMPMIRGGGVVVMVVVAEGNATWARR